jgi:radical SAM superfamily enzyme YgiQ (UPF0313 family)
MSRVCLIQCAGGESGKRDAPPVSTYNLAEPLGLLCLDAWLRQHGHEVLLLHPHCELNTVLSETDILQRAVSFRPDLAGFSSMTNQVPVTARLAKRLKTAIPGLPLVVGGDHFSSCPGDLAAYESFDFAVCGEGESAMLWLASNAHLPPAARSDLPNGIYWKDEEGVHGIGRTERAANLDALPYPRRYAGLVHWSEVGMLMWPPRSRQTGMVSLYASRGCPYSCTYCNARLIWGKGVGWRSSACVVDELRAARDQFGVNTAFFVDLTFNADMAAAHALCDAIAEADLGVSWYVLARPGNPQDRIRVDRPLLEVMQRAGCAKVGFGVETVSPAVARQLRRAQGNDYLFQIARWTDELGILSKAFLIIGHPAEDEAYYEYLGSYLDSLSVDEVRVSFLTPFPGTPLWDAHRHELPGRQDYDKFTTFRPILPHPCFAAPQLEQIRLDLLRRYYSSPRYLQRVREKVRHHPWLHDSFEVFLGAVRTELDISAAMAELPRMRDRASHEPVVEA